jgi:hypothetical protein
LQLVDGATVDTAISASATSQHHALRAMQRDAEAATRLGVEEGVLVMELPGDTLRYSSADGRLERRGGEGGLTGQWNLGSGAIGFEWLDQEQAAAVLLSVEFDVRGQTVQEVAESAVLRAGGLGGRRVQR